MFIIKKGSFEVATIGTVVSPDDPRPISVANFENRVIHAGFKEGLEVATKKFCHKAQQGFIGDLGKQVVELDAELHRQSMEGRGGGGLLCDVARAYPSVAHEFIFFFLEFV